MNNVWTRLDWNNSECWGGFLTFYKQTILLLYLSLNLNLFSMCCYIQVVSFSQASRPNYLVNLSCLAYPQPFKLWSSYPSSLGVLMQILLVENFTKHQALPDSDKVTNLKLKMSCFSNQVIQQQNNKMKILRFEVIL